MADSFLLFVNVACVTKTDILEDLLKGNITCLDYQVQMIRHKAVSMDTMPVSFNPLLKELTKPGPVSLGIKNILAAIATQNYMIKSARIMDTRFTGHIE